MNFLPVGLAVEIVRQYLKDARLPAIGTGSVTLHPIRVIAHSIRSVVREYTLAARR